MVKVLYEDNHLIVVYKSAGVLAQGDKTGDQCLMDQVKQYLREKYNKPGNIFLGLVHRLDRPVQGIVLLAKTSKGAARLSEQFRDQTVEKIYHALVVGQLPQSQGLLMHFLKKDEASNKTTVYEREIAGSKRAELAYEVIRSGVTHSLLKIRLGTGRGHQIRAQLAAMGCPIVGDVKYGAPEPLPDKSVALAATSLEFQLATHSHRQRVEVDIPREWAELLASG